MSCTKQPRFRETTRDTDSIFEPGYVRAYNSSGVLISETILSLELKRDTFYKSILDAHCVFERDLDPEGNPLNPCEEVVKGCYKKLCADCVTQSKQSYNAVLSKKHEYTSSSQTILLELTQAQGSIGAFKEIHLLNLNNSGHYAHILDTYVELPELYPTALELSDAMRKLEPSVAKFLPQMNIYETLFELNKLKELVNVFKKPKSVSSTGSAWLGFHFGAIPLISTINDIYAIVLNLDTIIDKWNNLCNNGQVMNFHSTIRQNEINGEASAFTYTGSSIYSGYTKQYKWNVNENNFAHMYVLGTPIPDSKRMLVALKALGLDKPLAGLWELTPFSWLIDYFVTVDDLIADWETGLANMFEFEVVACGYSIRRIITTQARTAYRMRDAAETETFSHWNETVDTHYERVPLPTTIVNDAIIPSVFGWANGPTDKQGTYILALGATYFKK